MFAQDITGKWHGLLKFPGGQLRISLNVSNTDNGFTATMDSPDQGAVNIPIPVVAFENNIFAFAIPDGKIDYKGALQNNTIQGSFTQSGTPLPLDFGREEITLTRKLRPQEPSKPYPYYEEEVTFKNEKANILLSGTLTLPKKDGNFPAVILITGSGPHNRDEELMEHRPFLVLADHLTKNGIAVLRYDDRGIGKSKGSFAQATTADFASDAEAAYHYLKTRKEINKKKIGLAGHSEGGTIAPMVAAQDEDVAFIVLMAGTTIPGDEILLLQNYLLGKAGGMPEEELTKLGIINRKLYNVIKEQEGQAMKDKLASIYKSDLRPLFISKGLPHADVDQYITMQVDEMSTPWFVYFIRHNPETSLRKVNCPILALYGAKDIQVAPVANLDALKRITEKSGNKKVTAKQLPGLNHLFQECNACTIEEYGIIEQTISPLALNEISEWINKQVK